MDDQPALIGDIELRMALDQASTLEVAPQEYRDEIERLRKKFGHRITVLRDRPHASPTCFAFALGLGDSPRYRQIVIARGVGLAPIHSGFVSDLLTRNEIQEREGACEVDDVVLYFKDSKLKHAGVVLTDGMMRSKWGPNEVHEHGLWEVPLDYGNAVKAYLPPNPDRILALVEAEIV